MKMSNSRAALLAALCFACVIIAGCNRGPAMYQVRGKVFYKDGSIPSGMGAVHFEPTNESTATIRKVASGNIGPDGSFELMTHKPSDGVVQGEYVVTIAVVESATDPTLLSAEKYRNAKTTPIPPITVDHNISDLKFDIEPSTGAPKN